jgi:hypothetical protein
MPGIYQQIPSFAFNAAEDSVAPKKVQTDGFLDNQFRVRATRDGTFETTKALVIEKNFQNHHRNTPANSFLDFIKIMS